MGRDAAHGMRELSEMNVSAEVGPRPELTWV